MHFEDAITFLNRISVRVVNDCTAGVAAVATARTDPDGVGVGAHTRANTVSSRDATNTMMPSDDVAMAFTDRITENVAQKTNAILSKFEDRLALLVPGAASKKRTAYAPPYWTKADHPELPTNVFFRNKMFRWKTSKKGKLAECQKGFKTMQAACEGLDVFKNTGQDISVAQ